MFVAKAMVFAALTVYCRGSRLENEISKTKLNDHRLLELVTSLHEELVKIQVDLSYMRRKVKRSYDILKAVRLSTTSCTPAAGIQGQQIDSVLNIAYKKCPPDFPLRRRDSCYHVEGRKLTWQKAQDHCKGMSAHLIAIETSDENQFLMSHINANKDIQNCDFWTDATDIQKEGDWVWNHTTEPLTFTNWHTLEPNNGRGDEHCMWLDWYFNWKWNDATCNKQTACFVCELQQK